MKLLLNKEHGGTIAELVPLYLRSGKQRGLSEITMMNLEIFGRWLVKHYGNWVADSFSIPEIRGLAWKYGRTCADRVCAVLRWGNRRGYIRNDNTFGAFEYCKRRIEIHYLSADDAGRFYDAVSPEFRAAFALALYAGLRPYEICRLKWGDINLSERRIRVPAEASKMRRARVIEAEEIQFVKILPTNLEIESKRKPGIPSLVFELLEPLQKERTEYIIPTRGNGSRKLVSSIVSAWLHERRRVADELNITLYPDIFRHSAFTHLAALSQDLGLVAKVSGHLDLSMIANYYDGVETRRAGEIYYRKIITTRKSNEVVITPEMLFWMACQGVEKPITEER